MGASQTKFGNHMQHKLIPLTTHERAIMAQMSKVQPGSRTIGLKLMKWEAFEKPVDKRINIHQSVYLIHLSLVCVSVLVLRHVYLLKHLSGHRRCPPNRNQALWPDQSPRKFDKM